ncbi:hypothetical protein A2715_00360 [Candidatus Woesebacteria bacterium RIFCSPHIGHO2_01_FULL_39_32]|uniref:Uncharacterized protein n=2 Tax=Candidatus Woeseibacteriota TaxID=1752722 RepID=A0A0G0PR68_9BACT|nr:MAG: hypothetical protein UT61_C0004G0051 [Candidatus Woesebacteria bacterium GW2011_GWA1_39_8]OGM03595.1 MAG: hypothetical protein A2124_01680 [Candidatus Woesebacteria bacterium GWB1_37_5]OGM24278.1 MAG: hypothetical protein A2715_00360 [Candidatus Woesebacteria bacterium RIFCSPHIGHO2_01_FULL_39_32]OGM35405.1 MAG: hypothetical protein A3F01_04715 [Candidatus Woesebacteria bacterium RIFCSPHIGHO2_12_FULL_38_11]OGM65349.1 MAG: hypothetical protein A2893_01315 [Candidatus Woesebacteria bacteri
MITDRKTELRQAVPRQEFAGFSAPPFYSDNELEGLLGYHIDLSDGFSIANPYYNFTEREQEPTFYLNLGSLKMTAGRIGAYSTRKTAAWIQELAWNYVHQDTMGKGFPIGDLESEQELLRLFMGDFSSDDLLIIVEYETQEGIKPIAGTRIVHGRGDRLVNISAFDNNSTLPTFQAVNLVDINRDFETTVLEVPEENAVCITRYWAQRADITTTLGVDRRSTPADVIAAMPLAYVLASGNNGRLVTPELAVFDIHRRDTADFVRRHFGARVVADRDGVIPTPQILETILRYHYGPSEIGGYQGQIIVGAFDTNGFLQKSLEYFTRRQIELPSLESIAT